MSSKPSRTGRTSGQHRNSRRTPEAEEKFLAALRAGKSIAAAARAAGIGRRTAYDWRDRDAAFAAAWDESWEIGTDYLEDLALKGAEERQRAPVAGTVEGPPTRRLPARRASF